MSICDNYLSNSSNYHYETDFRVYIAKVNSKVGFCKSAIGGLAKTIFIKRITACTGTYTFSLTQAISQQVSAAAIASAASSGRGIASRLNSRFTASCTSLLSALP